MTDHIRRSAQNALGWSILIIVQMIVSSWVDASLISPMHAQARSYTKTESSLEGGVHWRCKTPNGPLHIWIPPGYTRASAGVVVYVHGYHVNVDQAWRSFQLAEQFRKSRQNALFIVPEAPDGPDKKVNWDALTDLRQAVRDCNIRMPNGSWIIMGHSAAYRTVRGWVDHSRIAQMILLDALYSGQDDFHDFIDTKGKKLILISTETSERSHDFIKKIPFAVKRKRFPDTYEDFSRNQKRARMLYIKSQYSHHNMIANQKVIPLILRITPLKLLP